MATQNVPTVGVTVTSVNAKDTIAEDEKRAHKKQVYQAPTDSVSVESGVSVASSGDAKAPKAPDKFTKTQAALTDLKKSLVESGAKLTGNESGETLQENAELILEQLQGMIDESSDPREKKQLELKRDHLQKALTSYIATHAEDVGESQPVKTESSGTSTDTGTDSQQAALCNQMMTDLKALGIDVGDVTDQDIEKVRTVVTDKIGKELVAVQSKIRSISEEAAQIKEKLKTASSPEKEQLEQKLKDLTQEAQKLTARKQELTQGFGRFSATADQILARQIELDLHGEIKSQTTLENKSVKKTSAPVTSVKKSAGMLGTQSATSGTKASGGALLGTQSATDQSDDSYVQMGAQGAGGGSSPTSGAGRGGAMLGVQSAGGETGDTGEVDTSAVPTVAANDFTGTTMAIQSVGATMRGDAKKTDQQIKKLLKAALAGNWEAVKMCLLLLDKRAGQLMIGIGAQTIKSMQAYEKSTAALNKSLGNLSGKEADYSARLAKINSEINMYSMNRQAIANFLKDTMTAKEEITGTTHAILQKDSQIASKTTG